jgi:hypothetical protein
MSAADELQRLNANLLNLPSRLIEAMLHASLARDGGGGGGGGGRDRRGRCRRSGAGADDADDEGGGSPGPPPPGEAGPGVMSQTWPARPRSYESRMSDMKRRMQEPPDPYGAAMGLAGAASPFIPGLGRIVALMAQARHLAEMFDNFRQTQAQMRSA